MADNPSLTLEDIQGNVLGGFNKNHMSFIFFQMNDTAVGRAYLAAHQREIATTAEVGAFRDLYRVVTKHRGPHLGDLSPVEATWTNIAFTHLGLAKLAAAANLDLGTLPAEFVEGLRARAAQLGHTGASDPGQWDAAFQTDTIDGVLIIAADADDDRTKVVNRFTTELGTNGFTVLDTWVGDARPDELGHEHFGFKDGISQPGVLGFDEPDPSDPAQVVGQPGTDLIAPGEFVLGLPNQSGIDTTPTSASPPPPNAGYPDGTPPPPAPVECMVNGSFLVLERLHQDVPGFNAGVQEASDQLGLSPELTGSKFVGRHKSGCPLETVIVGIDTSTDDLSGAHPELLDDANINHFDYSDDQDGTKVPTAAHIRKAYPRSQTNPGEEESNRHRILRRGIAYGASLPEQPDPGPYGRGTQDDGVDRGLLFACYQASIANQFEFIQEKWVNTADFPVSASGIDPILNETDVASMTVPTAAVPTASVSLKSWVTVKGGGYFFAPGLHGLELLVGPPPADQTGSEG